MRLSPIIAAVLATAATAAAAEQSPCTAEKYTTVCRGGELPLRIIRGTLSPDRRYGVAWQVPSAAGAVEQWDDGSMLAASGAAANFLVRLSDGKAVAKLAGEHFGDHPRYNHREVNAIWSSNGSLVAILNQSKWMTDVSDVYLVSGNGVSKPVSLAASCRESGKAELARRQRRGGQTYVLSIDVSSVQIDGTIAARCEWQVIKKDDAFATGIRVRMVAGGNVPKAQLITSRSCSDDDERGICARGASQTD